MPSTNLFFADEEELYRGEIDFGLKEFQEVGFADFVPQQFAFQNDLAVAFAVLADAEQEYVRIVFADEWEGLFEEAVFDPVVAVDEPDVFSGGADKPGVTGSAQAAVFLFDNLDVRFACGEFADYFHRVVGSTVVYDDDFDGGTVKCLPENTLQCMPDVFFRFVDGYDDGEEHLDLFCFFEI